MSKPERVAVAWLQGGIIKILKRKKSIDGIVYIDKNNALLIPDGITPRLIRLIKWFPMPSFKWYPLYFANPEHALTLEIKEDHGKLTFKKKVDAKPIDLSKGKNITIIAEAISTQIEPNSESNKEEEFKYGLETMTAENLSTFLEGKQESMLARTTSDKLNLIMFIALGAVVGFLLGQVLPLSASAPVV